MPPLFLHSLRRCPPPAIGLPLEREGGAPAVGAALRRPLRRAPQTSLIALRAYRPLPFDPQTVARNAAEHEADQGVRKDKSGRYRIRRKAGRKGGGGRSEIFCQSLDNCATSTLEQHFLSLGPF